jgi:hypothetical protein
MPKYIIVTCLLLLGFTKKATAQYGFSHEIGAIVGPTAFQSDYGQRHNFTTNASNTGFGIGLIHYLNFSYKAECNCYTPETYFNDHFKLRTELSYTKAKLDHFGRWTEGGGTFARQLKAMHGEASVTDIGMQLEYFPFSIRDFSATIGAWGPFVSLGAHFNFFDPKATSDLGALDTPLTTPQKYIGATQNQSGTTWSIVTSVGTRYKLTTLSDLMVDLRLQYYFSDWVDGLKPDPALHPENKANDWNVWLNFGYIYYLN